MLKDIVNSAQKSSVTNGGRGGDLMIASFMLCISTGRHSKEKLCVLYTDDPCIILGLLCFVC